MASISRLRKKGVQGGVERASIVQERSFRVVVRPIRPHLPSSEPRPGSEWHASATADYPAIGTLPSSRAINLNILTRLYAVATNSSHSPVRSKPT